MAMRGRSDIMKTAMEDGVLITRARSDNRIISIDAPIVFGSDFIGAGTLGFPWLVSAVNSGTVVGYSAAAAPGGYILATTGGADDDDLDIGGPLCFTSTKGMNFEARLALRDVDQCSFNLGWSDTPAGEAADLIAINHATASLTSTATDFCGFFSSSDSTTNKVRAVSVAGDTDGTIISSGSLPADDEFFTIKCVVDPATRIPRYYYNGTALTASTDALTSTANLFCPYIALRTLNGNAEAMFVDYAWFWQARV